MKISKQKGTKDIFFDDVKIWQFIEDKIREIGKVYNLSEIRTPVFEATELFQRGVGNDTDVVNKEMYTFIDKGGRSITLRPELTAGVVRSYIENGFASEATPLKFWYAQNMYRYEKMQKGRYREFKQYGVEIFGSESYLADLEAIMISRELFKRIGMLDQVTLNINSIGCKECRSKYIEVLKEYIKPHLDKMCETCKVRYDKNPMRIIDCKEEKCQEILKNIPYITDYLCKDCKKDFENLKKCLEEVNIPYVVDKKIVRGLDYYNKTVFEYSSDKLNLALGGGGRYDTLVETLGGNHTPAVGFGLGLDRIQLVLKESQIYIKDEYNFDIYFAALSDYSYPIILKLVNELRNKNISCDYDICKRSFKSQLKYADKQKARYVAIIGEDEIKEGKCSIKDLVTGKQIDTKLDAEEIIKYINEFK